MDHPTDHNCLVTGVCSPTVFNRITDNPKVGDLRSPELLNWMILQVMDSSSYTYIMGI